jgi:hypothetical protein
MTPSDFRNTDPRTAVASALAMPPKRFVWAEHAGTLFFTALIISVLIHGALMLKFAQESFVHIDPAMLGQEREIIVVQRAPEQDVIVNPLPEEKSDTTQDKQPENMDQPAKEQDLVALSQALLDNNPPPAAASQQVTDDVAMRQVPDEKPADSLDEGKLAEGFPEVALQVTVRDPAVPVASHWPAVMLRIFSWAAAWLQASTPSPRSLLLRSLKNVMR